MAEQAPNKEEWRNLFEIMKKLAELKPWEWMEETDIFGVQNPETDEIGFVSVMGRMGEHYGVFVYLGDAGLYRFWEFQHEVPEPDPMKIFEIPHLQASFEDWEMLTEEDKQIIKKLGLKFRGRNAWPQFRSVKPGHLPYYIESGEARFLTFALSQLLEIAVRFKQDESLLEPDSEDEYLVRVLQGEDDGYVWVDQKLKITQPAAENINIPMNHDALENIKKLPDSDTTVDVDFFMIPAPVQDKQSKPYFPYMLLIVEDDSGMILGVTELMAPLPSINAMIGEIPKKFVETLVSADLRPKTVRVRPGILEDLLDTLVDDLGFVLKTETNMENLDQAKDALIKKFTD